MSKRLLESDFLTVDLRSVFNSSSTTEPAQPGALSEEASWQETLKKQGFAPDIIKKLEELGEPFVKALKILKIKENNPILAFVKQEYVQNNLLKLNLLNARTFRAIYNAVAKKLVADNEFFESNKYNIIYCKNLYYKKSPAEIEEYLILQSKILNPASQNYTEDIQKINRKVFLQIADLKNLDIAKRADTIKKLDDAKIVSDVSGAILNSIELAKKIHGNTEYDRVSLDADNQSKIIKQVEDSPAKVFASLLALSLSTDNESAKNAISNEIFGQLNTSQVAEATAWLAKNNVLPKGQLQDSDVEALVNSLLAKVTGKQQ